eukprot:NODE_113_length_18482_cov_1.630746.p6 type:complete len:380 gc:universal NODE_113_length_18482_cov_1.630746:5137-3998(-)
MLHHLFLFQGVGMLLPWNVIITAHDFFKLMFNHPTFQSYFAFYFNVSVVSVTLYWLRREVNYGNLSYIMISISFLIFLLMRLINQSHEYYFYLCCLLIALDGAATATIQSKIMALASIRGEKAIQYVLIGQGIAGLIVSLSDVLFKVLSLAGRKIFDPFIIYFLFAFIICILCLLIFSRLTNTTLLSVYEQIDDNQPNLDPDELLSEEESIDDPLNNYSLHEAKYHVMTCFTTLFVTLFLFPATTSLIIPIEDIDDEYYTSLFVPLGFFLYNLGDLSGRFITLIPNIQILFSASIGRISFAFLFPYLYLNTIEYRDIYFFIGLFIFGLSNGYITNAAMMLATQKFRNEQVGKVLNFSMLLGCVVGSCASVVLANCLVFK